MSNKKSKSARWLAAAVASLILVTVSTASFMTGCGCEQSASETMGTEQITESEKADESVVVTNTAAAKTEAGTEISEEEISEKTEIQSSLGDSDNSSSKGSSIESSHSSGSGNSVEKPESSNSKTGSNESSRSNGSGSQSSSGNSGGAAGSGGSNSSALVLDSHTFNVGDQVSCMINLKSSEDFENYQATINYDSKYLKLVSAKLQSPASGGGILNPKLEGTVPFNGVNLEGYDYSSGGNFVELVYKVVSSGTTSIDIDWQIITGLSGRDYAVDGKLVGGFTSSKVYTKL